MTESSACFAVMLEGGPVAWCQPGETVLTAAARAGAKIAVGCRGGGCGVCRVQILKGRYRTLSMSDAHIGATERDAEEALACRVLPEGDMELRSLNRRPLKKRGEAVQRWQ